MSPKPYTLHYFNKITFSLSQDKVGIWLMFHVKLNDRYCLKPKGQSMLVKDSNYKPGIMTASSSKNCSSPIPPFCSLGIAQQIRSEMENGGRFTYQNSTIQIFLSMADLPPLQITLQSTYTRYTWWDEGPDTGGLVWGQWWVAPSMDRLVQGRQFVAIDTTVCCSRYGHVCH